ncbi:hypothetical protein Cgig2_025086 [Carnegiea gigantea]|uniref:Large ribosomal subunit protein uL18c n=1 Tax=Carnegiea gigantea TaxID=171969 RepID=A0A9Q1KJH4_9CARY|nr:hypothetical protein Cgig2_025086 [Carnegiea gigantea]
MASAPSSLSFLHTTLASSSSHQLSLPPKFVTLRPRTLPFIEAKAHTRREDRSARHTRLRKKVTNPPFPFNLSLSLEQLNAHQLIFIERSVLPIIVKTRCNAESGNEVDDVLSGPQLQWLLVEGTSERPRLCVFRSNKHLYVQVIDDTKMHTLASASTMQKPISEEINYTSGPTIEVAKKIGEMIAKNCLEKGITKVVFDRGGYLYHGRVQALADAAREHGLEF